MTPDARIAATLALMASACAAGPDFGDEAPRFSCGTQSAGWIIDHPPADAETYRQLALQSPAFKSDNIPNTEWGHYDDETWLTKPTGEVVLCLADGPPWEAWSTQFWQFAPPNEHTGEIQIADQGATIIVG